MRLIIVGLFLICGCYLTNCSSISSKASATTNDDNENAAAETTILFREERQLPRKLDQGKKSISAGLAAIGRGLFGESGHEGGGGPPTRPPHVTPRPHADSVVLVKEEENEEDSTSSSSSSSGGGGSSTSYSSDHGSRPHFTPSNSEQGSSSSNTNSHSSDATAGSTPSASDDFGDYDETSQCDMFPVRISLHMQPELPFHSSHAHVDLSNCNVNYLNQVDQEIADTNFEIDRLRTRRMNLNRQRTSHQHSSDKLLDQYRPNKKTFARVQKVCGDRDSVLQELFEDNAYQMERQQQILRRQRLVRGAVRFGMDYRVHNPTHSFIIYLTEQGPILQRTKSLLPQPYPSPTKKPKQKRENVKTNSLFLDPQVDPLPHQHVHRHYSMPSSLLSEDEHDMTFPIARANSIREYVKLLDQVPKLIIVPDNNFLPEYQALVESLEDMVKMGVQTLRGYFTTAYYTKQTQTMESTFSLLDKILKNGEGNVNQKINCIRQTKELIHLCFNADLLWYSKPTYVIEKLRQTAAYYIKELV